MVNRQVNRRDKDRKGGFDYRPTDPKKLRERAERSGGSFDSYFKQGVDIYKPKVGENCLRICPPTFKDHDHFGMEIWVHGYVGSDRSSYLCPKKMLGKRCPICDAAADALAHGEKDDADDIKAKQRILYYVIDRDGGSDDPQVWSVSWTMDKEISGRCEKRSGKILELDNPWKGHDVSYRRTGQGLKTKYINVDVDSDVTALAERDKDVDRILDFVKEHPLDSILKFYGYDHLKGVISGEKAEKDEDLDDDDDRARGRKARGKDDEDEERPRSRKRDSEDDDEDEKPKRRNRSDNDEEDEERPRSRGRGRRDEDEDEDDKPSNRSRKSSRDEDEDDPADEDEDSGDDDDGKSAGRTRDRSARGRRDEEEDEDDKSSRRSSSKSRARDEDEDEDDGDKPKGRVSKRITTRATKRGDDEDEEDMPRGKRGSQAEEVEEEIPSSRRARRDD